MIISQVLIAVFVMRWLQSEWGSEKMLLQKNLFDQFMAARSRMMDSVISKNLIAPILKHHGDFEIETINHVGGPDHDSVKVVAYEKVTDSTIHTVTLTDTARIPHFKMSEDSKVTVRVVPDSADDQLYRGVKLLISKVSGQKGDAAFFERHVEEGDTTLLKTFFAENLAQQKLSVNTIWERDSVKKQWPPAPFYYEAHYFGQPFTAHVVGYNAYLIRQILPQMLFGLLLLLVTGGAFLFSYRSLRQQVQLAAIKDDFISNMSHELKTPLATMKVAVEAMQQMDPVAKKDTLKDYLAMASQELSRLDLLMNKVMNSILPENAVQPLHFEPVNLVNVIKDTLITATLNLEQHHANVQFHPVTEEVLVNGESIHLQGIFYNLIDNSLKYGKENPEIVIELYQSPAAVIVTFSDNGTGIPDDFLDKIFDKFMRVPSGNRHNVKGYGLGLHYVWQVMQQHKGSVRAENLPTGGCRFTLTFPVA